MAVGVKVLDHDTCIERNIGSGQGYNPTFDLCAFNEVWTALDVKRKITAVALSYQTVTK